MNNTIAVEHNLTPVVHYLTDRGYKVETIDVGKENTQNIDQYDALIITGLNKNFLGVQDTISKIPVIDAKGLSAEEVYDQLVSSLKQKQ